MRRVPTARRTLLALLLLPLLGSTPVEAKAKEQRVKLKFRAEVEKERTFVPLRRTLILAEEGADLPVGDAKRLTCRVLNKDRIKLDVKGDDSFKLTLKKNEIAKLKVHRGSGDPQAHAVRMVNDKYWRPCLEVAGARVGKLKTTRIAILDVNLNGRYGELGTDMMVVGKLPYAFPLSPLVVVGKVAYDIRVAEDGSEIIAKPREEALHKLDFVRELKRAKGTKGLKKPLMAVFRRLRPGAEEPKGATEFVTAFRSPALLPAGEWRLAYAVFDEDLWVIGAEDGPAMTVGAESARLAWGAPFTLTAAPENRDMGTKRTFIPPALLKAPQLKEERIRAKYLVIEYPPAILGRAKERYVGSWLNEDSGGVSMPDKRITHFDVVISKDGKKVNADMDRWAYWNMSGLVKAGEVFWTSFDWPVERLRGKVVITFTCKSPMFGDDVRSGPIEFIVK